MFENMRTKSPVFFGNEWVTITREGAIITQRMKAPGGWLVRTLLRDDSTQIYGPCAMTFVSDVGHDAEKYRSDGTFIRNDGLVDYWCKNCEKTFGHDEEEGEAICPHCDTLSEKRCS